LAVVLHHSLLRGRYGAWGAAAIVMMVTALGVLTSLQCMRYRDYETYFGKLIEDNSPQAWLAHYDLAVLKTEEQQYLAAIDQLRECLRENPNYAPAHNNLGRLCGLMGDTEEAIREYRKAVELRPRWALAHNNLAVQLINIGDEDGAVEHFRHAVEYMPDFHEARMNLARLLARKGRVAEARQEYREVLRRDRNNRGAQDALDRLPMR
jgi:Flp pilus assembly protein TadD